MTRAKARVAALIVALTTLGTTPARASSHSVNVSLDPPAIGLRDDDAKSYGDSWSTARGGGWFLRLSGGGGWLTEGGFAHGLRWGDLASSRASGPMYTSAMEIGGAIGRYDDFSIVNALGMGEATFPSGSWNGHVDGSALSHVAIGAALAHRWPLGGAMLRLQGIGGIAIEQLAVATDGSAQRFSAAGPWIEGRADLMFGAANLPLGVYASTEPLGAARFTIGIIVGFESVAYRGRY